MNETIAIETARAVGYNANLIISWVLYLITLMIVFISGKSKNAKMERFWLLFGLTTVISGVVVAGLILAPEFPTTLISFFKSFIN